MVKEGFVEIQFDEKEIENLSYEQMRQELLSFLAEFYDRSESIYWHQYLKNIKKFTEFCIHNKWFKDGRLRWSFGNMLSYDIHKRYTTLSMNGYLVTNDFLRIVAITKKLNEITFGKK